MRGPTSAGRITGRGRVFRYALSPPPPPPSRQGNRIVVFALGRGDSRDGITRFLRCGGGPPLAVSVKIFSRRHDPRGKNARHDLAEILFIALLGSAVRVRGMAEKRGFPVISAIARIVATRSLAGEAAKTSTRLFLLSKPLPAQRLVKAVRRNWHIEDRARTRKDNGPGNLAIPQKITLNLLQTHTGKISTRRKIERAGWDNRFLLSLLANMR